MKKINLIKLITALTFMFGVFGYSAYLAYAALPWGTVSNAAAGTASPTCTSFANAPVCILNMTTNVTSLTISGDPGTATNHMATLIMVQDGTGGRVFPSAIASFTGLLPSPASTAANKYTAYVLQFASNAFTVVGQYDNYPLTNFEFSTTQTLAAATFAPSASAAQPTIIAPGMTTSNTCLCVANQATNPIQLSCLPQTNAIQCVGTSSSGGTVTGTTATLNVRGLP